jgi:hypothetical protein
VRVLWFLAVVPATCSVNYGQRMAARILNSRNLVLLAIVFGCRPFAVTNTVVSKATSPNAKVVAILVDRRYHNARSSDEFSLILVQGTQSANSAIAARHIGESAALVATYASKLQLSWENDSTLRVVCNSCGLRPIDIEKKLTHLNAINIRYEGFPVDIAR